jgi:DNA-binding beta-propeller fold protein YncE
MMKNAKAHPVLSAGHATRFLAAALSLGALIGLESCGKSEKPAAKTTAGAGAPAAAPTAVAGPAPGPSIRQVAEPNRPPFSGLNSPRGAALDGKGRLWIVDMRNMAIRIFDASGGYFGGWGGPGTGEYAMKDPHGIAIHGDDVYIADSWGTGVELLSTSGKWITKIPSTVYGPHGIAVGPDGRVWIGDTGNNRVVVCDRDLTNARAIGKQGSGPEEFLAPLGIAVGPSGNVYVSDSGNRRIQVLDGNGNFKTRWKFNGFDPNTESYIDVDRDETLYVSDGVAQAVVHLDRSGKEIQRWTKDDAGQNFSRPTGLAIDKKNRILYVVNSDSNSVSKLRLSGK